MPVRVPRSKAEAPVAAGDTPHGGHSWVLRQTWPPVLLGQAASMEPGKACSLPVTCWSPMHFPIS